MISRFAFAKDIQHFERATVSQIPYFLIIKNVKKTVKRSKQTKKKVINPNDSKSYKV